MKASTVGITAGLWLGLAALSAESCSRPAQGPPAESQHSTKSLRVLVTGDVAGTLEPCGCVKDQLGGLDRFATAVFDAKRAPASIFLQVGSLYVPRETIDPAERSEALMRAETLARSMQSLGLTAWLPGAADFALGGGTLETLNRQSGAVMLHAPEGDTTTPTHSPSTWVKDIAGIRVGLYGLYSQSTSGRPSTQDLPSTLQAAAQALESQQAQVKIALLDAPMGAVTRAVRQVPAFQLAIVSASNAGFGADSDGQEPQLVDSTLIVNPPNHLRGLVTIDLSIRGNDFKFADASGVGREAERMQIGQRIVELAERIKQWKKEHRDAASIAAREADLTHLRQRLNELAQPIAAPHRSYFTIKSQPIGNAVDRNPEAQRALDELGRRINLYNRDQFAGRKAPPAAAGQPTYVGVKVCDSCHKEAVAFWQTTRHSRAYQTLVDKERQFTLECVGCHVTGYERPGGSSVTDVALLKDVQCENCHGPGSAHAAANTKEFIKAKPNRQLCATECHHSPHVDSAWNVNEAWRKIIGVGHGE